MPIHGFLVGFHFYVSKITTQLRCDSSHTAPNIEAESVMALRLASTSSQALVPFFDFLSRNLPLTKDSVRFGLARFFRLWFLSLLCNFS